MTEIIKTESVGKNFAKADGILLEETSTTALCFFPGLHPGGVRGDLVRFKKSATVSWKKIPEQDFRKLKIYEGVHIELGTEQLQKLCDESEKFRSIISQKGVQAGTKKYAISDASDVLLIDDTNIKGIIKKILENDYSEEFWSLLSESHPNLADKLTDAHLQAHRKKVVNELKYRLTQSFPETQGADCWQQWIYKHNWIFGVNYKEPIEKQKININGIMPDYLFPTIDNFVDILEIKLPSFEVIEEDKNHKGSWMWSKDSNSAVGQVVTYLNEIDRLRLEIERGVKQNYNKDILMLKPRAYILIGQSENWSNEKKEGLRKLNHALHGIEIITYTDLTRRGEAFIDSSVEI